MRRAKPQELKTHAVPVLTARITEAELGRWLPIPFDEITDPLAVPEPTRGALVQLESGSYVVVYYGRDSGQLFLEIPEATTDSSALVAEFFREVPLPTSRVLWLRPDITLPQHMQHGARQERGSDSKLGRDRGSADVAKRSAKRISLRKAPK